jgi:hypothetical protein
MSKGPHEQRAIVKGHRSVYCLQPDPRGWSGDLHGNVVSQCGVAGWVRWQYGEHRGLA